MKRAERTYGTHSSGTTWTLWESQNRRERSREAIWRNNSQKFPSPRRQIENQVGTPTEIGLKRPILRYIINISSKATNKERILKATREKQLVMHKTVPIRLSAGFQPRSCSLEGSGMIKINEKYTANQEYYIQQNYPLKKRRKTFPNKKCRSLSSLDQAYMKCLKKSYKLKQRDNKQQRKPCKSLKCLTKLNIETNIEPCGLYCRWVSFHLFVSSSISFTDVFIVV